MRNSWKSSLVCVLIFIGTYSVYFQTVIWFNSHRAPRSVDEMSVALPAEIQLLFAFGDRYLAANLGVFRSQTVGTHELKKDTYVTLAKVQLVTSRLNPRHEDNYYTAAAILPWNGQFEAAQQILARAANARATDPMPSFFLAFNQYYFLKDFKTAGKNLLVAADRSKGGNAIVLRAIASNWIERGYEPQEAKAMLLAMAKDTRHQRLASLLQARAKRLDGLIFLDQAVMKFKKRFGYIPSSLDQLVLSKTIDEIPVDPLGGGYVLGAHGCPQIKRNGVVEKVYSSCLQ